MHVGRVRDDERLPDMAQAELEALEDRQQREQQRRQRSAPAAEV
jgi:hypothetical protein